MVSYQMATRDAQSVSCVVSEAVVLETAHRGGVGVIAQPFLREPVSQDAFICTLPPFE